MRINPEEEMPSSSLFLSMSLHNKCSPAGTSLHSFPVEA
jgi:hypothetical protein